MKFNVLAWFAAYCSSGRKIPVSASRASATSVSGIPPPHCSSSLITIRCSIPTLSPTTFVWLAREFSCRASAVSCRPNPASRLPATDCDRAGGRRLGGADWRTARTRSTGPRWDACSPRRSRSKAPSAAATSPCAAKSNTFCPVFMYLVQFAYC